jgi:hypothetical protein
MKRRRLLPLALGLVAVIVIGLGVRYELKKRAERKREAGYQMAVRSYRQALKIGTTRKEVEDYLRARNIEFNQMCCVEEKKRALDDLTKIGEEAAPWFCSEHYVFVAFQFADDQPRPDKIFSAEDLDTLKSITVFHQLGGCL